MSGTIPPLPNTPLYNGAQLKIKHRENFALPLYLYQEILHSVPSCPGTNVIVHGIIIIIIIIVIIIIISVGTIMNLRAP